VASELDAIATDRLRVDGQRYTTNRQELVRLLADAPHPLTIPDLIALRSGLAQSSVYRNLAVLEQAGVVKRIVTADEWARYELADEFTEHHHHLICSQCGTVRDFTVTPKLERDIDVAIHAIAERHGFAVTHHTLDLVGRCQRCIKPESGAKRKKQS
jgi:Fur family transcriptional regulator, ferric uptake regulator